MWTSMIQIGMAIEQFRLHEMPTSTFWPLLAWVSPYVHGQARLQQNGTANFVSGRYIDSNVYVHLVAPFQISEPSLRLTSVGSM